MNPLSEAGLFLLQTVFDIYLFIVALRLLLQLSQADPYNPLSQALVRLTAPVLAPLERFIPKWRQLNLAAVVLLLALEAIKLSIIGFFEMGSLLPPHTLACLAMASALRSIFKIYFFAIMAVVILSWLGPRGYHPLLSALYSLTEPPLRLGRRIIPPLGGLDLSPIVVLVVIQLGNILIVTPLLQWGLRG